MKLHTTKSILIQFLVLVCVVPQNMALTTPQCYCQQFRRRRKEFHPSNLRLRSILLASSDKILSDEIIAEQEEKFKIITCMSTSCSRKRKSLGLDDLSTFGAMYSRASDSRVVVEEGPCIGSCKKGPCVSIEHEDFFGTVALEGMTADEFSSDAYVISRQLGRCELDDFAFCKIYKQ